MFSNAGLQYNRTRIRRTDGGFYDVAEVIVQGIDQVEFHKGINEPRERKLADVAHLRTLKALARGVVRPVIVVWDAYCHTALFGEIDLSKASDETVYVSKNATITYYLRYLLSSQNYLLKQGVLRVKETRSTKDRQTQHILDLLYSEGRIQVIQSDPTMSPEEIYKNLDPYRDLIPVGKLGFPSTYARETGFPVVFNTSYFLFEEEDYISDFSLFGDAYNLQIRDGVIESPPLYKRSALLLGYEGNVDLGTFSLADIKVRLFNKEWDLSQYAVYTRFCDVLQHDKTMTKTPLQPDNLDVIIIDRAIVGYKWGGGVEIPHNGFVLSLPIEEIPQGPWTNHVDYSLKDSMSYRAALQCGPGLIRAGNITLDQSTLRQEQFFQKRIKHGKIEDYGVVPTDYAPDIESTRAARTAIGVDSKGNFRVLVVEAVNRGMEESWGESTGVTLQELALLAHERGYEHALNVDGGGSSTIHYLFGQLTRGADRRGLPGVMYERMVPSVGIIRG